MAKINTGGHAYVGGKINAGGGKIYPGDDVVHGDKINGAKVVTNASEATPPPDLSEFPPGSILDKDFVGRGMYREGKHYKLYLPITQRDKMYVYVPA